MYFKTKKICCIVIMVIGGLLLSSGVWARETGEGQQQPIEQKVIRHIFFVTLDGVTENGLKNSYTPNLNGLASSGIYAPGTDVLPADTAYHLAAILSGADTEISGFNPVKHYIRTEVLPGMLKKYDRDAYYIAAQNTSAKKFFNTAHNSAKTELVSGNDQDIMAAALAAFEKNKPYFLGVVLSGAKNTTGRGTKYYKAIGASDEQLGRLLLKLKTMGVYDETLIVVTGSNSSKLTTVPVVLKGPGLKRGTLLPPVRIIDVAPTVAMLAGVNIHESSNGMVIWNGLAAGAGFVEEHLLQKRVKELSQGFMKATGSVYQLQEEKRLVHTEKEQLGKEKREIQNIIKQKDGKIKKLTNRIKVMQFTGVMLLVLCGLGYVLEYRLLRKKFLMF